MSKIVMSIYLIFFHNFVQNVNESLDNYADITFDGFLIKESVILSYYRRGSSDLLIHNNFTERK